MVHPTVVGQCSSRAVQFLLKQAHPGAPDFDCTLVVADGLVHLCGHLGGTCLCDIQFAVANEDVITVAKIVGVIYRRLVVRLPPPRRAVPPSGTAYPDASWPAVKLTTFVIALACQTHGTNEALTVVSTGGTTWLAQPGDVMLTFQYKAAEAVLVVGASTTYVPYVASLRRGETWHTRNPHAVGLLATALWQALVQALF